MNVLIYVMTMLMLLALMTYARLDSYRSSQIFQIVFKHYIAYDERGYFNSVEEKEYDTTHIPSKPGKNEAGKKDANEKKPAPKVNANPRISLSTFLDKKKRDENSPEWQQTTVLFKNLLTTLYRDQPFFQKMANDRPNFLDELIVQMSQSIDALPPEKQPKKATDFANLQLADPQLDEFFYKILHGAPYKNILEEKQKEMLPVSPEDKIDDDSEQDSSQLKQESEEYKSPEGYYSLLDFVTVSKPQKIRVYLAPREVLLAIYHDPAVVDQILNERKLFYRQIRNSSDPKEIKSLEEAFKSNFDSKKDAAIDSASLDYTITKTNPSKYD